MSNETESKTTDKLIVEQYRQKIEEIRYEVKYLITLSTIAFAAHGALFTAFIKILDRSDLIIETRFICIMGIVWGITVFLTSARFRGYIAVQYASIYDMEKQYKLKFNFIESNLRDIMNRKRIGKIAVWLFELVVKSRETSIIGFMHLFLSLFWIYELIFRT